MRLALLVVRVEVGQAHTDQPGRGQKRRDQVHQFLPAQTIGLGVADRGQLAGVECVDVDV